MTYCVLSLGNFKNILKELSCWSEPRQNALIVKADRLLDKLPWRDRIILS